MAFRPTSAGPGSTLIILSLIHICTELLREDDFYRDAHRLIFQAIKSLELKGEEVDLVTVTETLREKDALDKCGGMSYLATLANMVPSSAGIRYYAGIVQNKAMLRRLIRITGEINLRLSLIHI